MKNLNSLSEFEQHQWDKALREHVLRTGGILIGDTFMVGDFTYRVEGHGHENRLIFKRVDV